MNSTSTFPHLILRYRAGRGEARTAFLPPTASLTETDRNGKLADAGRRRGQLGDAPRQHADAQAARGEGGAASTAMPNCRSTASKTLEAQTAANPPARDQSGAGQGSQGRALRHLLRRLQRYRRSACRRSPCWQGTASRRKSCYPDCCGMPQLETGDPRRRGRGGAQRSRRPSRRTSTRAMTLSRRCRPARLMLKFEWPLHSAGRCKRQASG